MEVMIASTIAVMALAGTMALLITALRYYSLGRDKVQMSYDIRMFTLELIKTSQTNIAQCYDINAQQAFRITAFNGTAEDITDFYADLSGADTGLDFDPVRGYFVAWDKGPRVWRIDAPTPLASAGWTVSRLNTTTTPAPVDAMLDGQTGTLGKWKYVSNLDCFVGAIEPVAGNVWAFKPEGWQDPRSA